MAINAANHGLELVFEKKSGCNFYGDAGRLEQVVTNIVSNSVKYTPEGGRIKVSCGTRYTEGFIEVSDNGIGIPERDLPRIFDRFYRVDKARSRESGGTGLGLAIAKELVELHGGKIDIKSKVGSGTRVTITLPMVRV